MERLWIIGGSESRDLRSVHRMLGAYEALSHGQVVEIERVHGASIQVDAALASISPALRLQTGGPFMPNPALLDVIRGVVGERGLLTDPADTAAYTQDWRHLYRGHTAAVIRPASTDELAHVVRLCAESRVPIVPQ